MAHVAWSSIRVHDTETGRTKTIKPGSKVSASSLGLEQEDFDDLVENGSVRETPWPKGLSTDNPAAESPNRHRMNQLRLKREELEAELNSSGDVRGPSREEQQAEREAASSGQGGNAGQGGQ